jgi:hypothetical protein
MKQHGGSRLFRQRGLAVSRAAAQQQLSFKMSFPEVEALELG